MYSAPTPHRRRRSVGTAVRLLAVAASAALTASLLAGPASAQPAIGPAAAPAVDQGDAGDARQAIAGAYRAAYPDLTPAAARAAAAAQGQGESLKLALVEHPDTFGGAWFDPYAATYHIAVTTPAARSEVVDLGASLDLTVETHLVEYSLAELEELADELRTGSDALSRAADGQVGIDVTTNEVVVALPSSQLPRFGSAEVPAGVTLVEDEELAVELDVCTSRANCNDSLRSGLVLRRSGVEWCSAGFTARSSGTRWVLTSGHCAGLNESWSTGTSPNQTTIGPMTDAIDSGVVDAGAIRVDNASYAADTLGRIYISGTSWSPVVGAAPSMGFILQGETVCISARITAPATVGNPCGVIASTSDPQKRGMMRVSGYDACPGDSGGGWYWLSSSGNRWAYGLHSRSETGCNAAPNNSWFSPIPSFWTGLVYDTA
jgi:streptogrisin C